MIASQLTNLEGPFALAHTWVPYTYHLLAGQQAVDFYPVTRKDREGISGRNSICRVTRASVVHFFTVDRRYFTREEVWGGKFE